MRIAVLGTGLIGGSIGLAARARAGAHVSGYDADPQACELALRRGAIDACAEDLAGAVRDAEVVFVAVPVGATAELVRGVLELVGAGCVVSDVGSTKCAIVQATSDERFVGGHPLAGAETGGVENAREDLFDGATWYLTPTASTSEALYERLRSLLVSFGAQPAAIDADAHDRLMACVSHLPHVLANVLASQAVASFERERTQPAAGPSLTDAVRVAGASSAIWTDIYLANRGPLVEAVEEAIQRLQDVRVALARADAEELVVWNGRAGAAREALLDGDS